MQDGTGRFGFCVASIVFITIFYGLTTDRFIGSLPYVLIAYCLYKMARYLVPAHRLNLDDHATEVKGASQGQTQLLER